MMGVRAERKLPSGWSERAFLQAAFPRCVDRWALQSANLAPHLGYKVLILKVMLLGIEDRSKCVSLQHPDVGFAQCALQGGVRNDGEQALGCVETAPEIVVLPARATQEAREMFKLGSLESRRVRPIPKQNLFFSRRAMSCSRNPSAGASTSNDLKLLSSLNLSFLTENQVGFGPGSVTDAHSPRS